MQEKYIYRQLENNDVNLIDKMNIDFRKNFACVVNIKYFLNNINNFFYACIFENKIIGFLYGYKLNRLDNKGDMLYIHEVGVHDNFQKRGIGTKLLENVKIYCKQKNICRIFLATETKNIAACKLYEKAGGIKMMDHKSREVDVMYLFPIG